MPLPAPEGPQLPVRPPTIEGRPPTPLRPSPIESAPKLQSESVRLVLSQDLEKLKAQKAKLEYDLAHHNCIRLGLLTKDFEGEIVSLQKAISQLQEGQPLEAIDYLEEQAARNHLKIEETNLRQSRLFSEYQEVEKLLKQKQQALGNRVLPENREKFADDEQVLSAWAQYETGRINAQIRSEHPEWYIGKKTVLLETIAAERARMQRFHNLKTPEQIAQEALQKGIDPLEAYVSLRYAEIKTYGNWREQADLLGRTSDDISFENHQLDRMIGSLGGQSKTDVERLQKGQQIKISESLMPPLDKYREMLKLAKDSPQAVEEQLVGTYRVLEKEHDQILADLETAISSENKKAIGILKRRRSRVNLLLWQLNDVFKVHCDSQKKNLSLPLLAEQARQRETKNQLPDILTFSSVESIAPQKQALPEKLSGQPVKKEIALKLRGNEILKAPQGPDDKRPWASINARFVERALFRAFQESGISLPFDPEDIISGMAHNIDHYPEDIQGQPLIWMKYRLTEKHNGQWVDVSHAINSYEQLVEMLEKIEKAFPNDPFKLKPFHRIDVHMRKDAAELLTPDHLKQHPGVLTALARDLCRYLPPGAEENLKGIKFTLPGR